jgi:5-methyltetrahydrofolate--homocysteine methyltransferase
MDILREIAEALIKGDQKRVKTFVEEALRENIPVHEILQRGLVSGMDVVGERFRKDEMWIPEVMVSARAMNAGLEILEPLIRQSETTPRGKFVIGTVKDDLHDVGKNMVVIMMKGAGFQVIDLGINVSPERFVETIREEKPGVIGLSALLTLTLPHMERTIEAITGAGLRDQVKIMVGGAPVTQAFADKIGADGYAPDSAQAVRRARELMGLN